MCRAVQIFLCLKNFLLTGRQIFWRRKTSGIINGKITAGIRYKDVSTINGIWAPPYVASNFFIIYQFLWGKIKTDHYKWYPMEVQRSGTTRGVNIETSTVLVSGERGAVMHVSLTNTNKETIIIPVHLDIKERY